MTVWVRTPKKLEEEHMVMKNMGRRRGNAVGRKDREGK
jgi:hypothetical protein